MRRSGASLWIRRARPPQTSCTRSITFGAPPYRRGTSPFLARNPSPPLPPPWPGLGSPDVAWAGVARRREGRERRCSGFAEVGEDQPHVLARRVTFRRHLAREVRIRRGHLDALAGAVELPAVVQAAQRIAFDPAEMQRRAAMRAAIVEHLGAARFAAVERVVLAHDA